MDTPGYIVLSRLSAQRRSVEVIAHNLANADTPGYRASRMLFAEHVARQPGAATPRGGGGLSFTEDRATWRDDRAGPMQQTGNPLDLAIAGEGYFAVETPRGERYTRAGRFSMAADGRVVDMEGHALLGANRAPLLLAAGDTRIEVTADGGLRSENGPVGQLRIVRFEDSQSMLAEGNRLLAAPEGMQPLPVDRPGIVQGAVEGSNVQAVLEFSRLTEEMREFQLAAQFAEREGERLSSSVDRILRRR